MLTIIFQERPIQDLDWVIWMVVLALFVVAVSRILFSNNFEALGKLEKFQTVNDNQLLFGIIFQVTFAFLVGTLIVGYLKTDFDYLFDTPLLKVLAVAVGILLYFAIRTILARLSSYAFGLFQDQSFNLKTQNFFRVYAVILLWIGVLLVYFTQISDSWIFAAITLGLLIIRVLCFRSIFKNQTGKESKIWYYNILYLCALEILPILVLLKFLKTW